MKLMEFARDCGSAAGPSNCKSMKNSSYEEVDVALLQWFNQKEYQCLVPCVQRKPSSS
jgi:hypothetical protein